MQRPAGGRLDLRSPCSLGQLGLLVTTIVANTAEALNAGSALQESTPAAAAYSYAFLLFMLPHSLVAVSLVTALFTRMSHAAGEDDWPTVRDDLSLGLRTVGIFSVLATVGLVVLADTRRGRDGRRPGAGRRGARLGGVRRWRSA